MSKVVHRKKRLSSFKLIVLGFAAVIFVGALLFQRYVSQGLLYRTPAVTGLLLVRQLFCC